MMIQSRAQSCTRRPHWRTSSDQPFGYRASVFRTRFSKSIGDNDERYSPEANLTTNSTHHATPTVTSPLNFLYSLTIIYQLEVLNTPSRKICKVRCLRLKTSTGFFLPKLLAERCCLRHLSDGLVFHPRSDKDDSPRSTSQ